MYNYKHNYPLSYWKIPFIKLDPFVFASKIPNTYAKTFNMQIKNLNKNDHTKRTRQLFK